MDFPNKRNHKILNGQEILHLFFLWSSLKAGFLDEVEFVQEMEYKKFKKIGSKF